MASLDAARHQAVQQTTWVEPIQAAQRIRDGLSKLPGISIFQKSHYTCPGMPHLSLCCHQSALMPYKAVSANALLLCQFHVSIPS